MTQPAMGDVSTGMTGAGRLGQTLDPRELVPGSPEALQDVARQFDTYAQELEQVGVRLGRIDVPGWTGRAASAFHDSLATERSRWLQGSDMLSAGAAAIRDHAQVLLVAQRRAQEAIELWEQGVEATGAARERYASTLPLPVGTEAGATPPPFVDPGAEIRRTAEQVLEEARVLVRESGQRDAQALNDNRGRGRWVCAAVPAWMSWAWTAPPSCPWAPTASAESCPAAPTSWTRTPRARPSGGSPRSVPRRTLSSVPRRRRTPPPAWTACLWAGRPSPGPVRTSVHTPTSVASVPARPRKAGPVPASRATSPPEGTTTAPGPSVSRAVPRSASVVSWASR